MKKIAPPNQQEQINNKKIKQTLKINFDEQIKIVNGRSVHIETKNLLLSPTRFLNMFTDILIFKIPHNVLEQSRVVGEQVMLCFREMWEKKITDLDKINYLSEQVRDMFFALIQWIMESNYRVEAVEKHVTNGAWHCYIDCILRDYRNVRWIVEIKTRGNDEIRVTDKIQLGINMVICGDEVRYGFVLIINKNTLKITRYKVTVKEVKLLFTCINNWFKAMKLEKYMLGYNCYRKKKEVRI